MDSKFNYETFTARNSGYISTENQARMHELRLLIAGCGLGSSTTICAARMGFCNFTLIDGDVVDMHNLNRQFFDVDDINVPKVDALKKHILKINPDAKVDAVHAYLDKNNTDALVKNADIIFDTIDFLDLDAILSLHTSAKTYSKPVFTALSIGPGAGVLFFPPGSKASLVDVISADIEKSKSEGDVSYTNVFSKIMGRIGAHLDKEVVERVAKALTIMEDGRPCPASQIAVGSFTVAAMAVAMMHDWIAGRKIPEAPLLVAHSFKTHTSKLIDISG